MSCRVVADVYSLPDAVCSTAASLCRPHRRGACRPACRSPRPVAPGCDASRDHGVTPPFDHSLPGSWTFGLALLGDPRGRTSGRPKVWNTGTVLCSTMTPQRGADIAIDEERAASQLGLFRARLTARARCIAGAPGRRGGAIRGRRKHRFRPVARIAESQAACARGCRGGKRGPCGAAERVRSTSSRGRRVHRHCVLLFLFKVSGLYDRDELRLVHSTLDEVPLLVQLTGLFALGLAILQSIVLTGSLSASRIAALWIASFCAIVCARMVVRAMAGRTSPVERCLVIGETAQAGRIREKLASSRARAEVVASLPLANEDVTAADWVGIRKDNASGRKRTGCSSHHHRADHDRYHDTWST